MWATSQARNIENFGAHIIVATPPATPAKKSPAKKVQEVFAGFAGDLLHFSFKSAGVF